MLILFRINCIFAAVVIGGLLWLGAGIAQYTSEQHEAGLQAINYIFSFLIVGGNVTLFISSLDRSYPAARRLFRLCLVYAALVISYFMFLTIYLGAHLDFQILAVVGCLVAFKIALSFGTMVDALP